MIVLLLALIGVLVGLGLDELIVRLAVEPEDETEPSEEDDEEAAPDATGEPSAEAPDAPAGASLQAEAGTLVVEPDRSEWVRRTMVVGTTGGLFALAALRYDDLSHLALVTAYLCVLIVCGATDVISYRVPNVVTYPAIVGAVIVAAVMPGADFLEALAGGGLAAGVLLLPALFTGGVGMGMGDVKLAAFVGLTLGFRTVVLALIFMALAGGLAAALFLITRTRKRGEPIPYAPFISGGAAAAMLWVGTVFVELTW